MTVLENYIESHIHLITEKDTNFLFQNNVWSGQGCQYHDSMNTENFPGSATNDF